MAEISEESPTSINYHLDQSAAINIQARPSTDRKDYLLLKA
jgi:hypothetical protein